MTPRASVFQFLRLTLVRWLMPSGHALWTWGHEAGDNPVTSKEPRR